MKEVVWTLRGLRFTGLEWGAAEGGTPTIFLHGWLDHAGSWEKVVEPLGGWHVAPDHRGHGHSARVGEGTTYHFPDYLADLDALVDQLPNPVNLVGHSMGGTIATMYAGARPERVARLVSIDGLGLADGATEAADRLVAFLDGSKRPLVPKGYTSVEEAAEKLRRSMPFLEPEFALRLARRDTVATNDGVTWAHDLRHRIRSAIPYRHQHHQALLARVRCPVLSIHPEFSPFAPADVAALESALADLHVVTLAGASHMAHLQQPAEVAAAVGRFLGIAGPERPFPPTAAPPSP